MQAFWIWMEEIRYFYFGFFYWFRQRLELQQAGKILVNGSPKTGTTWMQFMLASLPGYWRAGNYQGDFNRFFHTKPGGVVHGHEPYSPELWSSLTTLDFQVVFMMRDPRDQTVSRYFHIRRDPYHPWHQVFQSIGPDEGLMACISGRTDHPDGGPDLPGCLAMILWTQTWLKNKENLIVVRYEDLLDQPKSIMQGVFSKLGLSVFTGLSDAIVNRNRFERLSSGKRIGKIGRKPGEEDPKSHFRKGIQGDWENRFSASHREHFKTLAGQALIELGYQTDLEW